MGVCGAAKWAGETVKMPRQPPRPGLCLFGKGVSVDYCYWEDPPKMDYRVIEVNEVNYCIVDTVLMEAVADVMPGKYQDMQHIDLYRHKAECIEHNLAVVLFYLRGKTDFCTCTVTRRIFALHIDSGEAYYL